MTVSLVLLAVMAVLYACGIYLMLERSMTRVLLGFLLVGNATNLLILIVAGPAGRAPIVGDGGGGGGGDRLADPLPQALILTAIVITFAVSAFLLALIYRSWRLGREDRVSDDEADVELRTAGLLPGSVSLLGEQSDADNSDTEFGVRADAAISGARDLAVDTDRMGADRGSTGRGSTDQGSTGRGSTDQGSTDPGVSGSGSAGAGEMPHGGSR